MTISDIPGIIISVLSGYALFAVIWFLLNLVANWKILSKAGKGGWQSFIPVWNTIARYGVSWSKLIGFIVAVVAPVMLALASGERDLPQWFNIAASVTGALAAVLSIIEKFKLSRAYGHGFFFGLGLLLLEPLFIMILAFGRSRYRGSR